MVALQWGVRELERNGVSDARLSAEVILAHALSVGRIDLYLRYDQPFPAACKAAYLDLVSRRGKGEPTAYLTGEKEFYSLRFSVDRRVLIPRPETELLVDEALAVIDSLPAVPTVSVCDVGTGSGAIAVAIKKNRPEIAVTAVDANAEALDVARANALQHGVDIAFIRGDLLREVPGPFDLLVANLPYVTSEDVAQLPKDVRDFEPATALDGGADGLRWIEPLLDQGRSRVRAGGSVVLEIGIGQEKKVADLLTRYGYSLRNMRKDYADIPRVAVASKGS
ncbi:MAG TPA: peptide chain release factor N(5)-glutamine methyltransferase [Bdellovibrionota bacterium]|nr:peptide chain release factor N(5)-glutamine methyltransferase [Bdellovibrionota bacterium]